MAIQAPSAWQLHYERHIAVAAGGDRHQARDAVFIRFCGFEQFRRELGGELKNLPGVAVVDLQDRRVSFGLRMCRSWELTSPPTLPRVFRRIDVGMLYPAHGESRTATVDSRRWVGSVRAYLLGDLSCITIREMKAIASRFAAMAT